MKKRTGLALAGGILEIIAGTYLLIYSLWALYICTQIPNGLSMYNWEFIIIFTCLILFGIFAIIGKTKKDLAGYGIFNLLFIGFLIYRAITATSTLSYAVAVILIFAVEIILLLIATMFFFFTPKSEYEIVFLKRLEEYKENEPDEHKKTKKIILITTIICAFLLALTPLFKIAGFMISAFIIIGYLIYTNIITKNNDTTYRHTANIVYNTLSLIVIFACAMIVSLTYSYTSSSMSVGHVKTAWLVENTYLYYDEVSNNYKILIGNYETDYDDYNNEIEVIIYHTNNNETYNELPTNAIEIIKKWSYYNPLIQDYSNAYEYLDTNVNQLYYYCEYYDQILDHIPEYKEIKENSQTNTALMIIVELAGLLIASVLIFATRNSQFEFEVRKQLKSEEIKMANNKFKNRQ